GQASTLRITLYAVIPSRTCPPRRFGDGGTVHLPRLMVRTFFEFRYSNLFRASIFEFRISAHTSRISHSSHALTLCRFNASTLQCPSFLTLAVDFVTTISRMPTYEYVCEKCGHQFEQFQSISAKPLQTCPETACAQKRWGKGKVKRAISGGAG